MRHLSRAVLLAAAFCSAPLTSAAQPFRGALWGDMPCARNNGAELTSAVSLKSFGSPVNHWVRITVEVQSPGVFTVRTVVVR